MLEFVSIVLQPVRFFSKFLLSLPYTNTPQAAGVQNTFSLVHVVDARATKIMLPSDNL